jgi:DNA recombination-mediator protein A
MSCLDCQRRAALLAAVAPAISRLSFTREGLLGLLGLPNEQLLQAAKVEDPEELLQRLQISLGAIARDLATAGVTIISGINQGLEGTAHHSALAGGGHTIAVMPGAAHTPWGRSHGASRQRCCKRATASRRSARGRTPWSAWASTMTWVCAVWYSSRLARLDDPQRHRGRHRARAWLVGRGGQPAERQRLSRRTGRAAGRRSPGAAGC